MAIGRTLALQSFLKEFRNQRDIRKAMIMPTSGASTIKLAVLRMMGEFTAFQPPAAMAAPANPPIRVWEEEEGIPYHQVRRFQRIAAINPERMTHNMLLVWISAGFTVLATVSATPWSLNMKNATELKMAAQRTA